MLIVAAVTGASPSSPVRLLVMMEMMELRLQSLTA